MSLGMMCLPYVFRYGDALCVMSPDIMLFTTDSRYDRVVCLFSSDVIKLLAHCLRYDCIFLCLKIYIIMFLSGIFRYDQIACLCPDCCFCLLFPNTSMTVFAMFLWIHLCCLLNVTRYGLS
jgi:hypothetical protein